VIGGLSRADISVRNQRRCCPTPWVICSILAPFPRDAKDIIPPLDIFPPGCTTRRQRDPRRLRRGLPTQGAAISRAGTVSARGRRGEGGILVDRGRGGVASGHRLRRRW